MSLTGQLETTFAGGSAIASYFLGSSSMGPYIKLAIGLAMLGIIITAAFFIIRLARRGS